MALRVVLMYAACAALWILISDRVVTLLVSDPARIGAISVAKGWAFVVATSALLYPLVRRAQRAADDGDATAAAAAEDSPVADRRRWLALGLGVAAVVVVGVGAMLYTSAREREKEVSRLEAVADLRAERISAWIAERRHDAALIASSRYLAERYGAWRATGGAVARDELLSRLEDYRASGGYLATALVDAGGRAILATGRDAVEATPVLTASARRALAEGQLVVAELALAGTREPAPVLDLVVPLKPAAGAAPVAVLLRFDVRQALYTQLIATPFRSATAETILVRRDGADLVYLSPLRFRDVAPLSLRLPLATVSIAAALNAGAARGSPDVTEGTDYRGVRVVAFARAVRGTDWSLVTKMDQSEIEAVSRRESIWIGLAGILALVAMAFAVLLANEQRDLRLGRALRRQQDEKLRAAELLTGIAAGSTDVIFAKDADGRYLLFNPAAERLAGRRAADVIGRDDTALFPAEEARLIRANDLRVMADDRVITFEEALRMPDGRELVYLATKGPLHLPGGAVVGMFGISRDISERSEAEAKLRENEHRWVMAIEGAGQGIWDWHLATRTLYLSPQCMAMLGIDGEFADPFSDWRARIHPEDIGAVTAAFQRHLRGGTPYYRQEYRVRAADGSYRHIFDQGRIVERDAAGRATRALGTHTDVSHLRSAEQRLHNLSLAVEQSPTSVVITDRDGRIEYMNAAYAAMLGCRAEDTHGARLGELQAAASLPAGAPELAQAIAADATWRGEVTRRAADGSTRTESVYVVPVRSTGGTVTHHLELRDDITERRRTGEELQLHRHHLQELVLRRTEELELANRELSRRAAEVSDLYNAAPCGYHSIDGDGVVRAINDTELSWLGYRREELVDVRRLADLMTPESVEVFNRNFGSLRRGEELKNIEIELRRRDGSCLPVVVNATAIFDADGRFLHSRSTVFDDTERRERGREVARLNAELSQRVRDAETANRAKSTFLANMSHEIRTPMNAIIGLTHLVRRASADPVERERLDKISDAADHLLSVVNDVLDISKIEAGKLTLQTGPFALRTMIRQLCVWIEERAEQKGLQLHVNVAPEVPDVLVGDATRLRQALLNYASNAVKFTRRGTITLRARLVEEATDSALVRFEVEDTGIGVDPQARARLFSAFEQADGSTTRKYGGTGLGLAITRLLAAQMGGEAGFESAAGHGSLFWFTARLARLPAEAVETAAADGTAAEAAAASTVPDEAALRERWQGARILLVEDNPVNREVAVELLTSVGLTVTIADDGARAVAQARELSFDLILMDVQMPVMDGLEAARAVRELPGHAQTPIIAITAGAFIDDRERTVLAGMNDYVAKPFTPAALYGALLPWLPDHGAAPVAAPPAPRRPTDDTTELAARILALPGLDAARGLPFAGRDYRKYAGFLDRFGSSAAADLTACKERLAAGDCAGAARLMHSLKGAAAFAGATDLQALATEAEAQLRREARAAALAGPLAALEAGLATLRAAIAALGDASRPAAGDGPAAAGPISAEAQLVLSRLARLLEAGDTEAGTVLREHGPLVRAVLRERGALLERYVMRFDYEAALRLLQQEHVA